MRKISSSVKCSSSIAFRSRADARSWPNGFSTIRRVQPFAPLRRLPSASTIVENATGGTAR